MELRRYLDPRTTWKDTSEVDKVRLYTRQSFVAIIVGMAIAGLAESIAREAWLAFAALTVSSVAAIVVVHRIPAIGGTASGSIRWPLGISLASAVLAGTLGGHAVPAWTLLVVSIPCVAVLSLRWTLTAAVVLGIATIPTRYGIAGGVAAFFIVVLMAATVRLSVWLLNLVTELDSSRHAAAALSVAEERLRFSRDLHDVVGRSLSAIAVKSELAAALARRGDDRAAAQMDEVRDLAQQSMTDARQLVRGYRSIDLAAEIDGARSLLKAAGISTDVLGRVEDIRREHAEAAAWVVREGATNVLRHSDATEIRIDLRDNVVTMTNDNPRESATSDGTGISSLRERLATVGGTVDVVCTADEFTLTATFPSTVDA